MEHVLIGLFACVCFGLYLIIGGYLYTKILSFLLKKIPEFRYETIEYDIFESSGSFCYLNFFILLSICIFYVIGCGIKTIF